MCKKSKELLSTFESDFGKGTRCALLLDLSNLLVKTSGQEILLNFIHMLWLSHLKYSSVQSADVLLDLTQCPQEGSLGLSIILKSSYSILFDEGWANGRPKEWIKGPLEN